jgi:hypothetical protein
MTDNYKIEKDPWFVTWTKTRIRARKKRVDRLQARINEPPHRIEVKHLERWMKYVGCKTLTELVQVRKQHLYGGREDIPLTAFVEKLRNEGVAESVIGRATSTIRGFYRDVGLPLTEFHRASAAKRASASTR